MSDFFNTSPYQLNLMYLLSTTFFFKSTVSSNPLLRPTLWWYRLILMAVCVDSLVDSNNPIYAHRDLVKWENSFSLFICSYFFCPHVRYFMYTRSNMNRISRIDQFNNANHNNRLYHNGQSGVPYLNVWWRIVSPLLARDLKPFWTITAFTYDIECKWPWPVAFDVSCQRY